MTDIAAVVTDVFTEVIGEPPGKGGATTPADVDGWDSLTHVYLVHSVESRLGVTLDATVLVDCDRLDRIIEAARSARGMG
ncbi:acyl carrier protein [Micromonospora sp. CA-246542]|uniref:acyl carrier protein n=1 Tax=Micromonospora sp. CA-246542 TaxID=3239959 RepID=UPI003D918058